MTLSIQNQTPTLPKSHSDFTKISPRLYQNQPPTLPKSQSDFTKIRPRLYQNHTPTLPKSHPDFARKLKHFHKIIFIEIW